MRHWRRARLTIAALGLLALPGVLSGCTTNPATGESTFTGLVTKEDEIRLGRQYHPQFVREFGGEYGSPDLKRYVESVAQLLAQTTERRDLDYTFTVLNSPQTNAFAVPGGYIYVTRGLLALMNDESELAAVLAHELGHITALHYARGAGRNMLANLALAGLGIAGGQQAGELGQLLATAVIQGYSREQENESDRLAARYTKRAGYDPSGITRFLQTIRAESQLMAKIHGRSETEVDQVNYLSSHPAPIDRVQATRALVGDVKTTAEMRARDIYLDKIDGMLYGDDPEQGFIKGREFAHPKLKFRFEVPDGFRLVNSTNAVLALGPDDSRIVFDQAKQPSAGPLTFYLSDVWAKGQALKELESLTINGLEAATATVRAQTREGARDFRLVAIRIDLQTIYRFLFITRPAVTARMEVGFRRTTYSFGRLSDAQAAALKPLRIRVVRVGASDNVARLAARMPFAELREERFRVLNGLAEGEEVRPGQRVKLVTE